MWGEWGAKSGTVIVKGRVGGARAGCQGLSTPPWDTVPTIEDLFLFPDSKRLRTFHGLWPGLQGVLNRHFSSVRSLASSTTTLPRSFPNKRLQRLSADYS